MDTNSTSDNSVIMSDVEENTTFYYSNFKLFNESSEILFTKYLAFKKSLNNFLGEDWNGYAKTTIYKKNDESKMFVASSAIFNNALEIWLELRKEINFNEKVDKDQATTDISFEENRVFEVFDLKVKDKFKGYELDEGSYHAVIQAFYISAIKVWKETINSPSYNPLLDAQNEGFVKESKKFILNKLQTLYKSKSKMLKPILVATERFRDYIYRENNKMVHLNSEVNNLMQDEKEYKNMSNFSSNLQIETPKTQLGSPNSIAHEDLKVNFKNLSIAEPRSDGFPTNSLKRRASQTSTYIEIKKVNKKTEKLLNQNLIEFASHYVTNFVQTTNKDWQITRNFVTSMIEINYNKLIQLETKITVKANDIKNDIKIRFIQPAQEFYNQLMEIWIIIKTNSLNKDILFTEYLEKVKAKLGDLWSEKFITPTQNFFMTLYFEWNHIKQSDLDNEEKVLLFIKKVKENMMKVWEENIVKKAEELTNKTLSMN